MKLAFLVVLLLCFLSVSAVSVSPNVNNVKVQKSVDLNSAVVKASFIISVENSGSAVVDEYLFAVEPEVESRLSYLSATMKDDGHEVNLEQSHVMIDAKNRGYNFKLVKGIKSGETQTVTVEAFFSHLLEPYPHQIIQAEKQHIRFFTNRHFFSPYPSKSVTTVFTLPSLHVESYTKTKPVSLADKQITYGPLTDVAPFSNDEILLHYENNNPFLAITEMTRVVEISHWGNIAIEETIDIRHIGAVLKGPFSRLDYQRNNDGLSSVKAFKSVLPASARDVYYRDEIGNISTSHLRENEDSVEVVLTPRFPLFGGWKTRYVLGYNVPCYEYLFHRGDQYGLKLRFVDHIYDDQIIDRMVLKVILPEGSSKIEFYPPYKVKRRGDEKHYTYLDTVGRPVLVAEKENLVEAHIQDFELIYHFPQFYLVQEPLLIVLAFYLLFVSVIIIVRLDFSITKDETKECRMRNEALAENVQNIQDKRTALYQSLDDAINKFKSHKDPPTYQSERKKIENDLKALTDQIKALIVKAKTTGATFIDKLNEMNGYDSSMRELLMSLGQMTEKFIGQKMKKEDYVASINRIKKEREEILVKLEALSASL